MRTSLLVVFAGVVFGSAIPDAVADTIINQARSKCLGYGYSPGTESFANCTIEETRALPQSPMQSQHQKECDEIRSRMPSANQIALDEALVGSRGMNHAARVRVALFLELKAKGCI